MQYQSDSWQIEKEHWGAWWNATTDREPIFIISAPNPSPEHQIQFPAVDAETQWTDVDFFTLVARYKSECRCLYEQAFPWVCASLGPGSLNTMLGTEPHFAPNTVWYDPCWDTLDQTNVGLDANNKWYQWCMKATKELVDRSQGRWIVAIPDLMENIDVLSAMRGNMELLYELVDEPQHIHRLQKQLLPVWKQVYDEIYNIVKDDHGGSVWEAFDIWAPGRILKAQCDFSAMIGKSMFDEFVLPYLEEQLDMVDYTIYHLDGPDAIKHLDSILSLKRLRCVQWVPGAGHPDVQHPVWDDIYRKTLDAGKAIHVCVPPSDALDFAKRWGTKDLLMIVYCSDANEASELAASLRALRFN